MQILVYRFFIFFLALLRCFFVLNLFALFLTRSLVIFVSVLLYVVAPRPPTWSVFKIFSVFLDSSSLIIKCLGVVSLCLTCFCSLSFLNMIQDGANSPKWGNSGPAPREERVLGGENSNPRKSQNHQGSFVREEEKQSREKAKTKKPRAPGSPVYINILSLL